VDLLDFLLIESNKLPQEQRLSHGEINSVLMDILGAGHDTVRPPLLSFSVLSLPNIYLIFSFVVFFLGLILCLIDGELVFV
jgi:hypothetical protein